MEPRLQIIKNDPYLEPFENAIDARYNYAIAKEQELTGGNQTLAEFDRDFFLARGVHLSSFHVFILLFNVQDQSDPFFRS